jgi:hypothetical protein
LEEDKAHRGLEDIAPADIAPAADTEPDRVGADIVVDMVAGAYIEVE